MSSSSSTSLLEPIDGMNASETSISSSDEDQHEFTRDVAIIGMACRVAGGSNNPEELWHSLLAGKDASGEMPPDRWKTYYHRDPRNPDILANTTSRGYYLDNLDAFDAQFFGISPMEAEQLDPQQRVSLEVAWEALENAGLVIKNLSGSDTAVFWGVNSDDYSKLVLEDLPNVEPWMGIGTAYCGVPNRISYHLNLLGPSTAVDAACASSLVAVHHAVQAIRAGESTVAIAGGVNALCGPGLFRALDRAGALSPEGRCQSFDDDAHGYGRGEGAAALVFKDMSQAIQDQDKVLGIIKGTAVAHDGKTNGIMAPNADSQALVCRRALKVAGIDPMSVAYIEAHATSTPLGDPTEVSALASVYGAGRIDDPCLLGSIKPNIGHLEAGAGAIGLIKAIMAVQKGVIPMQTNLNRLTTRIDWPSSGLKVVQTSTNWPRSNSVRRAAVSSYGYGGTVSHAIIQDFTPQPRMLLDTRVRPLVSDATVLLLSGRQEKHLVLQARALRRWLDCNPNVSSIASVASTLALRRDHHDYRAALVVENREDAVKALSGISEGSASPWANQDRSDKSINENGIVWIFSGHGAHWGDMGKDLLTNETFRVAIEPLDHIVVREAGFSPIEMLRNGGFESSDCVQILTYIMQIGISAMFNRLGVFPSAVIGHSVGEIAASVVAGALSPEEGAIIVSRRAVLYRKFMGHGAMIMVNESYDLTSRALQGQDDVVAAIDASPSACVVSGPVQGVQLAAEQFKERGIRVFNVKTDIAFHSPMLQTLIDPLVASLDGDCSPTLPTRASLYSTSLQDPRGQDLRGSAYWANNMVNPVRLTSAVQAALEDSHRIFMEISAHPLVSHSVNETVMHADVEDYLCIPTLTRNTSTLKSVLLAISKLHCRGVHVDWQYQMTEPWATGLPNTCWIHRPTWRKVETAPKSLAQVHDPKSHTLLGGRIQVAGTDTVLYTSRLDQSSKPFPLSHPLHGTEIVPAACLLNTLFKATGTCVLQDIALRVPLAISNPRSVQVVLQRNEFKIMSQLIEMDDKVEQDCSSWVTHTTAKSEGHNGNSAPNQHPNVDIDTTKSNISTRLKDSFTIDYLRDQGVSAMGFPWLVHEHYGNTMEMLARVSAMPDINTKHDLPWDSSSWAPLFDSATSIGSTLFFDEPRLRMPAHVQRVEQCTCDEPPIEYWIHVKQTTGCPFTCDITILGVTGTVFAKIMAMRYSEIEGTSNSSGRMASLVHQLAWTPAELSKDPMSLKMAILICSDARLAERYISTVPRGVHTHLLSSVHALRQYHVTHPLETDTVIVYIPSEDDSNPDIAAVAESFTWQLLEILKFTIHHSLPAKVFVLTCNAGEAEHISALAYAPLVGLSRILASEHPEAFGGLIDNETTIFPLSAMRQVQGADVIRIRGGLMTVARLQRLRQDHLLPSAQASQLLPRPEGTYLITGGVGVLGLKVASFLASKGARRLVLVSRRSIPPRKTWCDIKDEGTSSIISKIKALEDLGVSVHVLSLDISIPTAADSMLAALDKLSWPPVLGVVHAAGVLDSQLALDTTQDAFFRVLAPKVAGGMALHQAFPPGSIDFFIMFSSCGQLVGFTGQSSYGSANAFLDSLAAHRRAQGDRAVSFLWTSWRGKGMGSSADFIQAELQSKGITDVTSDEAFAAWMHLSKYNIDHGVVLRTLEFHENEILPSAILEDIAVRRRDSAVEIEDSKGQELNLPLSSAEMKSYLTNTIRGCVAKVLHMDVSEVDPKIALSDIGIDSVMTVTLRLALQKALKLKVPSTLTWSYPTVSHLVGWFTEKLGESC